jgi:predicted phosphodiesterase
MIIDCIADLHGFYPQLEGGDVLIVAGDLTASDTPIELVRFREWLCSQQYRKIIYIGGNHDNEIENETPCTGGKILDINFDELAIYLCDSATEFEGLKIWGSPWTKRFDGMNPKCKAFTVDTDQELDEKWKLIPDDTDILVTHGPALRNLDGDELGSRSLLKWQANHVGTLKLHVFGHIHEGYGVYDITHLQEQLGDPKTTIFVNASHVDSKYRPVNSPIRVIL